MFLDYRSLYEREVVSATYVLSVLTGTFSEEGQDVQLTKESELVIGTATFPFTASSVGLTIVSPSEEEMTGGGGGDWADFVLKKRRPYPRPTPKHYTITVESASFPSVTAPVSLVFSRVLSAHAGEYKLEAGAVSLRKYSTLIVRSASYYVTVNEIRMALHRAVQLESGGYRITINDVALMLDRSALDRLLADDDWVLLNVA